MYNSDVKHDRVKGGPVDLLGRAYTYRHPVRLPDSSFRCFQDTRVPRLLGRLRAADRCCIIRHTTFFRHSFPRDVTRA